MKTKTKLTNGNTLAIEPLEGGAHRVAVVDSTGDVISAWSGELPADLADTLAATVFRMVRTCAVCGARFRAKRATASTCSASCRTRAWRSRSEVGSIDAGELITIAVTATVSLGAWIAGGRAYDALKAAIVRRRSVLVGEQPRTPPPPDRIVGGQVEGVDGGGYRAACSCSYVGTTRDDEHDAEQDLVRHLLGEHGAGS